MICENVRPLKAVKALQYLLQNSEMFQNGDIYIDDELTKKWASISGNQTCCLDSKLCDKQNIVNEQCTLDEEVSDGDSDEDVDQCNVGSTNIM